MWGQIEHNAYRVWRRLFLLIFVLFFAKAAYSATVDTSIDLAYPDKTSLVEQQITLLKNRVMRAQAELKYLQKQERLSPPTSVTEKMVKQSTLDVAAAQSSLDSINIELTESRQTVSQLEKELQELENQLNVVNMFGLKITRYSPTDLERLYEDRQDHKDLLKLEKIRTQELLDLQNDALSALQFYQSNSTKLQSLYQNEVLLQLKNQQSHAEIEFQNKQNTWLRHLDSLESELTVLHQSGRGTEQQYDQLRSNIFYTKEQVDFMYFQMLLTRYQDQIKQLDIAINAGKSISYLNNLSIRMQTLSKQLDLLQSLLLSRQKILIENQNFYQETQKDELTNLETQYAAAMSEITQSKIKLVNFRHTLDKALQEEISSRQGLPGLNLKAWINLGAEILLIPHLAFQVFRSLGSTTINAIANVHIWKTIFLVFFEVAWIISAVFLFQFLKYRVLTMPDHEAGHVNLRWLIIKLLQRMIPDLAVFGTIAWFFIFLNVPLQNYLVLVDLAFVWLIFRAILLTARVYLVETIHTDAGYDVMLYRQLKWIFLTGGAITALSVFIGQLPIGYGVIDLFDRLFMLFLFAASLLLIRQWKQLSDLLLTFIDQKRTYLIRLIRTMCLMIPIILLVNSLVGLSGYVNLVLTVSWYECIFIIVLAGYLLIRGLLNDAMDFASRILIRHVTNGWLWMEAFLKPIDRILQIAWFLLAWAILFLFYGWDRQSSVVERLNALLHYPLANILNTVIMPISMIEIAVTIYLLYWGARWTREFVYRLLLSRTKDLGLRNSIAILSQYAMIVCGILISLSLLGIDFKALTVVATALAFGVGLGLRDLVNNFACGFLLLIERPLRIGDTISIGDYEGEVLHIGGRAITIRTWDHIDVVVPNTEVFTKSFSNWTAKDSIVRTVIPIQVDRQDRPQTIQKMIVDVLHKHKDVLTDPAPEVLAKEMSDGLTGFEVRYYLNLRQVKSRPRLRSEILVEIWETFEKHNIRAPYPSRQVFLEDMTVKKS